MALALFDLDNTLLAGDSDHLWGEFLVQVGAVDATFYKEKNDHFYRLYQQGALDIHEYLAFALQPLTQHPLQQLLAWRAQFVSEAIAPIVAPGTPALLQQHQERGDTLLIITATNAFVTAPIAEHLGIEHLIATDPETRDGRYTGAVQGTPSFQAGKVTRLQQWLADRGETLHGSYFYSDSHNDVPLLKQVEHPVAVDPDPTLKALAEARGWPVISLRGT